MRAFSFKFWNSWGEDIDTDFAKDINLGLVEREYGDLSLIKDVVSAEVTLNGYKTTYTYEELKDVDGFDSNAGFFKKNNDNTIEKIMNLEHQIMMNKLEEF